MVGHEVIRLDQRSDDVPIGVDSDGAELTIIGAGLSGGALLRDLLGRLPKRPRPYRIAVLDRSGDFWGGVSYGWRSGDGTIISDLRRFLPSDERVRFGCWLSRRGIPSDDESYPRRRDFGRYFSEVVDSEVLKAQVRGIASVSRIACGVYDCEPLSDGYRLYLNDGSRLVTHSVVLATGGTAPSPLCCLLPDIRRLGALLVDDIYAIGSVRTGMQGLGDSVDRILGVLNERVSSEILVVGSQASALELLTQVEEGTRCDRATGSSDFGVTIMSPSGRVPVPADAGPAHVHGGPWLEALDRLVAARTVRANDVENAISVDMARLLAAGVQEGDAIEQTGAYIGSLLDRMDPVQQQAFVDRAGVQIGRMQRRAGPHYRAGYDRLRSENRLRVIPDNFSPDRISIIDDPPSLKSRGGWWQDLKPDVIVNATGSAPVSASGGLISKLLDRGLIAPTRSESGINVNSRFEAAGRLYILGPFLAGNLNERLRIWHLESCPRILKLAPDLADIISSELQGVFIDVGL